MARAMLLSLLLARLEAEVVGEWTGASSSSSEVVLGAARLRLGRDSITINNKMVV